MRAVIARRARFLMFLAVFGSLRAASRKGRLDYTDVTYQLNAITRSGRHATLVQRLQSGFMPPFATGAGGMDAKCLQKGRALAQPLAQTRVLALPYESESTQTRQISSR